VLYHNKKQQNFFQISNKQTPVIPLDMAQIPGVGGGGGTVFLLTADKLVNVSEFSKSPTNPLKK